MSSASLPLIRPLAVPVEHGAWGFLLEPILLGLLVAPSPAGALIGMGGLAVFLLRHPLKLAIRDWSRRRRYPRTKLCEMLVVLYGLAALITLGAAFSRAMIPLLFAIPFGATQFILDFRNRSRVLTAELAGAIAPAALVASIVLAGGEPVAMAMSVSALVIAYSIPAVLCVRSTLRGENRVVMLTAHVVAIAVAAFVSWPATIAMVILLSRAIPRASGTRAQTIGLREIGWGAITMLLAAFGFRG